MRLLRIAALVLSLGLGLVTSAWSQSDPLNDANQLFRQGQFDRAMERVNGYLATRPKDARGRFLKGLILTEQNKPGEAIKVFTDLSQDFPELPEPHNNLAALYAAAGEFEKARTSLAETLRLNPSSAAAHENLGDVYARLAEQSWQRAMRLEPASRSLPAKLKVVRALATTTPTQEPRPQ